MSNKTRTWIGAMWVAISTGLSKLATLITQIVLGWLLTKEDFGLYALALSIASSVSLLRNGGTQQILIQRGKNYKELAPAIFNFSLLFNGLACIVLLGISNYVSEIYHAPELKIMLVVISFSTILLTPQLILRSRLIIDRRFKEVSFVGLVSNLCRQGATVLCAYLGLGYMSFVWPILLEPIVTCLVAFYFVKEWIGIKKTTYEKFKTIFSDARWVMLGSLALALSTTGQYFIIGLFENKTDLGVYFFSFQLIIVLSVIITNTIETVMLPVLSSYNAKDYAKVYSNIIFVIVTISISISCIGYSGAEWCITSVWKEKWESSIPLIKILVMTIPALLVMNFNKVVMESKGLWGKRLINLMLFSIGDMVVAGVAAYKYNIYEIAVCVTLYRLSYSIFQCLWMTKIVNNSIRMVLSAIVPNIFLIILLYCFINFYINQIYIGNYTSILTGLIVVMVFLTINTATESKRIKKVTEIG